MTKEPEKIELTNEELNAVSAGCWFRCSGSALLSYEVNGHTYKWFKCDDCGSEWFQKDGKNIEPTEFMRVAYGIRFECLEK